MNRNKYYPPELKKRIVQDAEAEKNISAVARRYGVNRNAIYKWMVEDQQGFLDGERLPINTSEVERMAKELAKMKQLLGEKELEIEILKDMVKKTTQRSRTIASTPSRMWLRPQNPGPLTLLWIRGQLPW